MKYQCGFFLAVMLLASIPLNAQYIRTPDPALKHNEKTFGNKMLRGSGYALGYNAVIMTALILSPEYISQWDRKEAFRAASIKAQYKKTFTTAPIMDNDLAVINFIGHPYQGSFYFNATRSQGALFWQSSLFTIMQSVLWEYVWEGGLEQPSIQDLIITPLGGILLGELSHRATLAMGNNGFQWYEIILTCIINPAYAFNNGFTRPASGGN